MPPTPPSAAEEQEAKDLDDMEVEAAAEESKGADTAPPTSVYPEVEIFINTLVLTTLQRYNLHADAALASALLVQRCGSFNRRSLDVISSKAYFHFSLAFENVGRLGEIRPTLLTVSASARVRCVPCKCMLTHCTLSPFSHLPHPHMHMHIYARIPFSSTARRVSAATRWGKRCCSTCCCAITCTIT